jgi:hypothetical protein
MTTVTQAEFARRMASRMGRVVARSTVKRWADQGKLVLKGDKVDLEASIARMEQLGVGALRPDVSQRHQHENRAKAATEGHRGRNGAQATAQQAPRADNLTEAATADGISSEELGLGLGADDRRTRFKRITRHYQNQILKLSMGLSRGQVHWLRDVRAEGLALGNALRAGIERLIDETAPGLAANRDPSIRRQILERESRKLKKLIAQEYPKSLRRLRQSARNPKGQP